MPLTMRPTGLGSGIDKDRPDYTVFTGEWEVGRIYQTRGGSDGLRWFWSLTDHRSDGALQSSGELGGSQRGHGSMPARLSPSANAAGRDEVYRGLRT